MPHLHFLLTCLNRLWRTLKSCIWKRIGDKINQIWKIFIYNSIKIIAYYYIHSIYQFLSKIWIQVCTPTQVITFSVNIFTKIIYLNINCIGHIFPPITQSIYQIEGRTLIFWIFHYLKLQDLIRYYNYITSVNNMKIMDMKILVQVIMQIVHYYKITQKKFRS